MTWARATAAWAVAAAAVLAAHAALVDGALLALAGASASSMIAGAVAAAGLAALAGVAAAPALAAIAAVARRAGRAMPLAVALSGFACAWWVLDPRTRLAWPGYVAVAVVAAAGVGASAWLTRAQPPALARGAAAALLAFATAADVWLEASLYPEMHAVAYLVAATAAFALVDPLRQRWRGVRPRALLAAVCAAIAAASFAVAAADWIGPAWRAASVHHGRHATRVARAVRAVVDFDGDGFSAIAWGTDCDDGDAARHPRAVDEPGGGDANCNGVDAPAAPTPADRGLAPPTGSPDISGGVDLVVLITVDSLRGDVAVPALMPNLTALASTGVAFDRAYAAGTGTDITMPLVFRPDDGMPSVAETLRGRSVVTRAVISKNIDTGWLGFPRSKWIGRDGSAVADAAVSALAEVDGPTLLWVHLYDPHEPRAVRDAVGVPDARPSLPAAYRSEVAYADAAIGRIVAAVPAGAVVIVTGDHGEGLDDHGIWEHTRSGFEEIVRVPLVVRGPGLAHGRYPGVVSHRDLPATLLGAFGLADEAAAAEVFGRSLWRLRANAMAPLHDFVVTRSARYSSGRLGLSALAVMVDERHKLVASFEDGLRELFDLVDDPHERRDRVADRADVARAMWRRLAIYCDLDRYPAEAVFKR